MFNLPYPIMDCDVNVLRALRGDFPVPAPAHISLDMLCCHGYIRRKYLNLFGPWQLTEGGRCFLVLYERACTDSRYQSEERKRLHDEIHRLGPGREEVERLNAKLQKMLAEASRSSQPA